ncbi:NYN domain-containing protein [Demequina globuliformis]|uniref:NYN domain-containing protein n=1 Tax=Demequina globuliformis TaxID=676202 RepID=UPI00078193E4|nr:NYN domain-containing protein [Demequina globuliformis]
MTTSQDQARLAVLIDADNIPSKYVDALFVEIARFGSADIRRAYGDWTTNQLAPWKKVVLANSIQPAQQFSNTQGKNSTDSALIIDAMDLLHAGNIDGVCLVSSDADFTRLAARIREQGLRAYGFGEKKTPDAFINACNTFVLLENIQGGEADAGNVPQRDYRSDQDLARLLSEAIDTSAGDDEWADLAAVGSNLQRLKSDFDTRTWGFKKLKDLVVAHPRVDVKYLSPGQGKPKTLQVRRRPAPKKK